MPPTSTTASRTSTSSIAGGNKLIIRNIKSMEAPDPHTLVVTTTVTEPLLPRLLGETGLISPSTTAHGKIAFNLAGNCGVTGA